MYNVSRDKKRILIADDSAMNREILSEMLGQEYEILEAEDGRQAVEIMQARHEEISVVLLDMVMPVMDGMQVLAVMNENHWMEDLPVIMISAESGASYIHQAYEMGVTDYITRPFDAVVVHHRVVNTILLYAKKRQLFDMVAEQLAKNEQLKIDLEQLYRTMMQADRTRA